METKPCSRCLRPADFSLALLLSTIRVRPRAQKCSQTIALCNSCINDVLASLATSSLLDLQKAFINAHTSIAGRSVIAPNGQCQQLLSPTAGLHQDRGAAVDHKADKPISALEKVL